MLHPALPVLLGLLAYGIVGIGPAILLIGRRGRLALTLCLAGPLGLALTALAGTVLVRLGFPVAVWAWPWLLLMGLVSLTALLLCRLRSRRGPRATARDHGNRDDRFALVVLAGATALALVLLLAPVVVGGVQYTAFRYNRWDALNYQTMARYMAWRPLPWIQTANERLLTDTDAFFLWTQQQLKSRYTTAVLMAWVARLSGAPIASVEYTHSLVYLLLAIGPVLALASLARLPVWLGGVLGLAVSTGFWGVIVVDMRAESQANSIPIVLLLAVAAALLAEAPAPVAAAPRRGSAVLLALALAALVSVYAEIIPMVLAGLVFFVLCQWWQSRGGRSLALPVLLATAAGLAIGCLAWPRALEFIRAQTEHAAAHPVNWDVLYFPWLWNFPWRDIPLGIWGLTVFAEPGSSGRPGLTDVLWLILAVILCALFLCEAVRILRTRESPPALVISLALALAALAQFAGLWARGQRWAAGKGLLFGYAFIVAAVALGVAWPGGAAPAGGPGRRWFARVAVGILTIWLVIQGLAGPLYRIHLAGQGREPANYLSSEVYMRRFDYDLHPFQAVLARTPGAPLGVAIGSAWLTNYFGLGLGEDRRVFDWAGVRDRDADRWKRTVIARPAVVPATRFLLVQKVPATLRALHGAIMVAQNKDFALLRSDDGHWGAGQTIITWSRAFQTNAQGNTRVKLDQEPLLIDVLNLDPSPADMLLVAAIKPAAGLPAGADASVLLDTDRPLGLMTGTASRGWKVRIPVRIEPGIQGITLTLPSTAPGAAAWLYDLRLLPAGTPETKPAF